MGEPPESEGEGCRLFLGSRHALEKEFKRVAPDSVVVVVVVVVFNEGTYQGSTASRSKTEIKYTGCKTPSGTSDGLGVPPGVRGGLIPFCLQGSGFLCLLSWTQRSQACYFFVQ